MDARKTVPTFYFYFCILNFIYLLLFFFAMFCIDVCYFSNFFNSFFVFFMFTVFGIPDIERRKKKDESSRRPATRIFVRK